MGRWLHVCALQELTPGTRRVVEVGAYEEVLVLNVAGTVYAISNICAHEGAALQRGHVDDDVLYCPLHRWGFALASGACVTDPTLYGRVYPVTIQDGQIYLQLSCNPTTPRD